MKYKTILQIDDDIDDRGFFKEALESVSDSQYIGLNSAVEALKQLSEKKLQPDLIVLDINMPKMDGITLLKFLRADSKIEYIPVIIFSTCPDDFRNGTSDLGILDYVTKPYNFGDLKLVLKQILFG